MTTQQKKSNKKAIENYHKKMSDKVTKYNNNDYQLGIYKYDFEQGDPNYNKIDPISFEIQPKSIAERKINSIKKYRRVMHFLRVQNKESRKLPLILAQRGSLNDFVIKRMKQLGLDLTKTIERCEKVYNRCETVYNLIAVKACPDHMMRIGCCSCAPTCTGQFIEQGDYCKKPNVYKPYKFGSKEQCERMAGPENCFVLDEDDASNSEVFEKCKRGYYMNKETNGYCEYKCPEGFSDNQNGKCKKINIIFSGQPFPWCPKDEMSHNDSE